MVAFCLHGSLYSCHPSHPLLQPEKPSSSQSSLGRVAAHPHSNAQTVICRTAHLLPNTQRDALQRREGYIYLEVIKMLSLKILPSKLVFSPAHLIPLWAPLLQGLSALSVLQTASELSCFVSKPWLMWSLPGAHVPQGPAWWPQINARDICHHSEPVLPIPSSLWASPSTSHGWQ